MMKQVKSLIPIVIIRHIWYNKQKSFLISLRSHRTKFTDQSI